MEYIIHRGSGTWIAVEECELVTLPDDFDLSDVDSANDLLELAGDWVQPLPAVIQHR